MNSDYLSPSVLESAAAMTRASSEEFRAAVEAEVFHEHTDWHRAMQSLAEIKRVHGTKISGSKLMRLLLDQGWTPPGGGLR